MLPFTCFQLLGPGREVQDVEGQRILRDDFVLSRQRGLQADLALAMARRVRRQARPDLRLVAMSATLDPRPVARFLGDCPVLVIPAGLAEASPCGDLVPA